MDKTPPPTLYLIVAGNPATGFRFIGPYDAEDTAEEARWNLQSELDGGEAAFVAPMDPPDAP